MALRIRDAFLEWFLSVGFQAGRYTSAPGFENGVQGRQFLRRLFSDDRGLARLRAHLSGETGWRHLRDCTDTVLLEKVATALASGSLRLESRPLVRTSASAPRRAQAPIEAAPEEWVEASPDPLAEEAPTPEVFALSHSEAVALAAENRELHESGAPFKEHCANQADCPVCAAAAKVMAA